MEDASVEKATNQAEVKRGGTVSVVGGGLPLAAALIISPSNPYFIPFPSVFTLFCHDKGFHSTYEKLQKCQHIPQKTNKTSDQLCVCVCVKVIHLMQVCFVRKGPVLSSVFGWWTSE